MNRAQTLRKSFPIFSFDSFSWNSEGTNLHINFSYSLGTEYSFNSQLTIHSLEENVLSSLSKEEMDAYIASIGMSELLSYWKLTASPQIEISTYPFTDKQLAFWKTLLLEGMGEYFYQNQIDFSDPDFVTFISKSATTPEFPKQSNPHNQSLPTKVLIPVGGGKDSAVTLELLSKNFETGSLVISAPQSATDTIQAAQIPPENQLKVTRKLDPLMLELNSQDFLNGHVPISASLAFISLLVARLNNYTHIAISNERSSNEGNVWYCDKEINHQYSKTYAFESSLQHYTNQFLPPRTPLYFSFLRPIYELQIGKLFAQYEQYHQVFRSCNRGQKTNVWCGECSKCLFAWVILYPFIPEEKLAHYFGKNLFEEESLWSVAKELLGLSTTKPFECVGTHEESIAAFWLSIQRFKQNHSAQPLPLVLEKAEQELQTNKKLQTNAEGQTNISLRAEAVLNSWNTQHTLPSEFEAILKNAL